MPHCSPWHAPVHPGAAGGLKQQWVRRRVNARTSVTRHRRRRRCRAPASTVIAPPFYPLYSPLRRRLRPVQPQERVYRPLKVQLCPQVHRRRCSCHRGSRPPVLGMLPPPCADPCCPFPCCSSTQRSLYSASADLSKVKSSLRCAAAAAALLPPACHHASLSTARPAAVRACCGGADPADPRPGATHACPHLQRHPDLPCQVPVRLRRLLQAQGLGLLRHRPPEVQRRPDPGPGAGQAAAATAAGGLGWRGGGRRTPLHCSASRAPVGAAACLSAGARHAAAATPPPP